MISVDMRLYNYFTIGTPNTYGQPQMPTKDAVPDGQVKMAIYPTGTSIQDNINYKDCNYIGLTKAKVKDTFIIEYGAERLKVQYINPIGRYSQVYLKKV